MISVIQAPEHHHAVSRRRLKEWERVTTPAVRSRAIRLPRRNRPQLELAFHQRLSGIAVQGAAQRRPGFDRVHGDVHHGARGFAHLTGYDVARSLDESGSLKTQGK